MGWFMLFVGLLLPILAGWWLISQRRADVVLTLLGLASIPLIVWAASLGAKIGPCNVGSCMSSGQHSRYVFALPGLAVLAGALGLLAVRQALPAALALIVAQILAAIAMTRSDTAALVMFVIFILAELGYIAYIYAGRAASQVPDYPPTA